MSIILCNNICSILPIVFLLFSFFFSDSESSNLYNFVRKIFPDKTYSEFSCKVCDYKSQYATNIKRHVRLHTGERPYKCHICFKGFNEKGHLKKHLFVHGTENVMYS